MRGAQPDAECPRCHHRQPPSHGVLVTCLECGLAYPPKELQRRSKPLDNSDALAIVQPAGLRLVTVDDELSYCWTDRELDGTIAIAAATLMSLFVWISMLPLYQKLGYSGFLVALAIYGLLEMRRRPHVQVDRNRLRGAHETLLLSDIARISVYGGQITAIDRYGKIHEIATARDHQIAAYIADDLARRLGQDEEVD